MSQQFDFLESFIHSMLDEAGFAEMTEATRNQFVPMFTAEAERRLGLALLPLLNDAQLKNLADLTANEAIDENEMLRFWESSIPDFRKVVQSTLTNFAAEFKKNLAAIS